MQKPTSRLLNVRDAANYLSISRANLYIWLKSGKIISYKLGGRRLIDINDLNLFIENLKNQ
ncbi:helix-turn-helix domain-containing protein [bacterium]|nr:helix-turn-helix domain-containing protein [bacterium]